MSRLGSVHNSILVPLNEFESILILFAECIFC